jgi:hypothetical protein
MARSDRRVRPWTALLALLALFPVSASAPVAGGGAIPHPPPLPQAEDPGGIEVRALGPERQAALAARLAAWDALPLAQRAERRERYRAWRALEEGERAQLRAAAAELASFDPARVAALQAQFAALEPVERDGWRLGPELGADFTGLAPLLGFVPAGQREPLLSMLRAMPAPQRADLARLAQRTPPPQRNALRETLLRLSPQQRGPWLRERLAD